MVADLRGSALSQQEDLTSTSFGPRPPPSPPSCRSLYLNLTGMLSVVVTDDVERQLLSR